MSAKVLLLDIETAPSLGWAWEKWQTNIIAFEKSWFMLAFGWKWLGEAKAHVRCLPDYAGYEFDKENDRELIGELWTLMDQADVIVGHNGDAFDIKKANARFITHDLPPPSTYKTVDTLKLAKKHFKFESNKLGDLGQYLEIGTKVATTGFKLWKGCMEGDVKSWNLMRKYNEQDVLLLEQIYLKLRPWSVSHPNLSLYEDVHTNCPTCTSSNVQRRGFNYAKTQVRQRWRCNDCGSWYSGRIIKKGEDGTE